MVMLAVGFNAPSCPSLPLFTCTCAVVPANNKLTTIAAKERRERKNDFPLLCSVCSLAAILGFIFMVLSLLLFGRFFAQRACGFLFARRRRDELHAARGGFALALADVFEESLQVVTWFVREVVARLADFSQDLILFHGSRFQQIERGANRGTWPARPRAKAFDLPTDGNVVDVRAIPSQQNIHPMHRRHRDV